MLAVVGTGIVMFVLGYAAAYISLIHHQQRAERALRECGSILKAIALAQELEDKLRADRSREGYV